MLKEDKYKLLSFIEGYSLKEVIETLAAISKEKADEMVDNLLKERAIEWANYHCLLNDLSKKIEQ